MSLPATYQLRHATVKDSWPIRLMVIGEMLDPTQIRWQNFWVVECDRTLVGCVQLRNFEGAQELGSLVVKSAWRHQGVGTYLARHAIDHASQPLFLECVGQPLATFYQTLGFTSIEWHQLPSALQGKFGLGQQAKRWLKLPVFAMQYQENSAHQHLIGDHPLDDAPQRSP